MANKVKFGLRNVTYSKITTSYDAEKNEYTYSYATPVTIPGAVSLSMSASGDTNDFFADDAIYFSSTTNQGYEGDLEIALVPESFLIDIMGQTKDSNGALIENADAVPTSFALGFEVQGDLKGRRTWLYNCNATRPNQDASTKETSTEPSTETLSLKAMPRLSDKAIKAVMELSDDNAAAYNSFFSSVYETNKSI